jgi:hypothetical protein
MIETNFKPGEYCMFSYQEIHSVLDDMVQKIPFNYAHAAENNDCVLIDASGKLAPFSTCLMTDGYLEYVEITREQFLYKATRCKSVDPVFDPEKPFEVSNNNVDWYHLDGYYLAFDDNFKHHVICQNSKYVSYPFVRNVQPEFNSTMLLAGQYMRVDDNHYPEYKDEVICRTDENHLVWVNGLIVFREGVTKLKGRRVNVDLIVREV